VIHSLEEDGDVGVSSCFRSKPFSCSVTDVEKVPLFEVGQEIHVMQSVSQPRLGCLNESPATVGKIVRIDMDGALNVSLVLCYILNFTLLTRRPVITFKLAITYDWLSFL
jgi:E3 ubiquitin-protein ligase KEG